MYCVALDQPVSGKKSPESANPFVHICSLDLFDELPLLARVRLQRARRRTLFAFILATALNLAGCDREPSVVYISEDPPRVSVEVSASANNVLVGQEVFLYATRYNKGNWKKVNHKSLPEGSCWLSRPPQNREAQVADNIHWTVDPAGSARFNTEYRADHSRVVIFSQPGRYWIRGSSAVRCGDPQVTVPAELEIRVRGREDG